MSALSASWLLSAVTRYLTCIVMQITDQAFLSALSASWLLSTVTIYLILTCIVIQITDQAFLSALSASWLLSAVSRPSDSVDSVSCSDILDFFRFRFFSYKIHSLKNSTVPQRCIKYMTRFTEHVAFQSHQKISNLFIL